jgi:hypothetical protein
MAITGAFSFACRGIAAVRIGFLMDAVDATVEGNGKSCLVSPNLLLTLARLSNKQTGSQID